ncbi:restriction endonuclease, partial (plasmid) [Enterobacter hormaechei]|nr:restriction endonuclease [Enterobacter hormaechei]
MGSCAAPSAKGDDKFITTDYLQQCPTENLILWACSAIALLAVVFFRRSVRHRRHKRKQQSARRVLERIKTLPGFPQKINYLRKIDPFVFEELLLEGFEAHGFRTIRNKRYTGDGGID